MLQHSQPLAGKSAGKDPTVQLSFDLNGCTEYVKDAAKLRDAVLSRWRAVESTASDTVASGEATTGTPAASLLSCGAEHQSIETHISCYDIALTAFQAPSRL